MTTTSRPAANADGSRIQLPEAYFQAQADYPTELARWKHVALASKRTSAKLLASITKQSVQTRVERESTTNHINQALSMSPPAEPVASRTQPRWGAFCMVLSILFFSLNSLTLKHLGQSDVSPWIALLFRAGVGMVFVALLFGFSGQVSFRRALTNRMLAYRGLLGVLGTIAYYLTVPALGAGKATLINSTYVVIAALMAVWFLKETFSAAKLAGNAIAFLGLTMLIAMPAQLVLFGWADLVAVFGAFMAAGTVIVIRKLTLTESTAMIYTSQCVYVLLGSLPMAVYELQRNQIDNNSILALILAGFSATIGQLTMTEGFRHLTVAVGGAFQICVPLVIAIGGVLLFGETYSSAQMVGAALILGGCYWVMAVR